MRPEDPASLFLRAVGWAGARRAALSGDASARRYERLEGPGGSAILMVVPAGNEPMTRSFLAVTRWLRARGFSAPEILASDPGHGLTLLEDLGDDLFLRLCATSPTLEGPLYEAAIDLLAELHAEPLPDGAGWTPPAYDLATILREARLALEWYLPSPSPDAAQAEYAALLAGGFETIAPHAPVAVYRDYHAENLVWLPHREGRRRVGLLDYQDMLAGHPAYDVVSLLEDARRDVAPDLRAAMTERYIARTGRESEAFRYAAHLLSAQRNLKILGIFARLARRDGKPRYLSHLPRVWRYLLADLGHPGLAPVRAFVARHIPAPEAEHLARLGACAA
jgi:N-acetylmuramate 1-kinase